MREFSNIITLVKNARGVWDIDPTKGCIGGKYYNGRGCYGECYAARYSRRYGYNFNKTVLRHFKSGNHIRAVVRKINAIDMPFIRMGVSGDPSEAWDHSIDIAEKINTHKPIVIITKHWINLNDQQIYRMSKLNIILNTSISALDPVSRFNNSFSQHTRLSHILRCVLRVVSCDFNINNKTGNRLNTIQDYLFSQVNTIDNILRVSPKNKLVTNGIINISEIQFLGKKCYASINNNDTFIGYCADCPEMCGVNLF